MPARHRKYRPTANVVGPMTWIALFAVAALAAPGCTGNTAASEPAANLPAVAPPAPATAAQSGHTSSNPGSTSAAMPSTAGGRNKPAAATAPEHSYFVQHPTPRPMLNAPTRERFIAPTKPSCRGAWTSLMHTGQFRDAHRDVR